MLFEISALSFDQRKFLDTLSLGLYLLPFYHELKVLGGLLSFGLMKFGPCIVQDDLLFVLLGSKSLKIFLEPCSFLRCLQLGFLILNLGSDTIDLLSLGDFFSVPFMPKLGIDSNGFFLKLIKFLPCTLNVFILLLLTELIQ